MEGAGGRGTFTVALLLAALVIPEGREGGKRRFYYWISAL